MQKRVISIDFAGVPGTNLRSALRYAEVGILVVPLYPGTKKPITELVSNGANSATTDPDIIREWWTKYPNANIGLATGHKFNVYDHDSYKPDSDPLPFAPHGFCQITASGGRHYFFNTSKKLTAAGRKGADAKNLGGYVVAYPSVIKDKGKVTRIGRYRFQGWDMWSDPFPELPDAPDHITTDFQELELSVHEPEEYDINQLPTSCQLLISGDGWDNYNNDRSKVLYGIYKDCDKAGWNANQIMTMLESEKPWKKAGLPSKFSESQLWKDIQRNLAKLEPVKETNFKIQKIAPRCPEPYPGVMEQYVDAYMKSAFAPQPDLAVMASLIGMASGCSGEVYIKDNGMRLNLYAILLGETGDGKEKVKWLANSIANASGAQVLGKAGSSAGLEDSIKDDYQNILLSWEEMGHVLKESNTSVHQTGISGLLLRLYSESASTFYPRVLKGKVSEPILHPCVNLIGFSTPEVLGKSLKSESFEDGLIGRMLMAFSGKVEKRWLTPEFKLPVSDKASEVQQTKKPITWTTEGKDALDEVFERFNSNQQYKFIEVRSFEKVLKIAGVLAVWENPKNPQINKDMVQWAEKLVKYSNHCCIRFLEQYHCGSEVQANAQKILREMKNKQKGSSQGENDRIRIGLMPRSVILRKSGLPAKDFSIAIDHLIQRKEIVSEDHIMNKQSGQHSKMAILKLP